MQQLAPAPAPAAASPQLAHAAAMLGDLSLRVKLSEDRSLVFLYTAEAGDDAGLVAIPARALPWLLNALSRVMIGARL